MTELGSKVKELRRSSWPWMSAPPTHTKASGVKALGGTVARRKDGCSVVFKKKEKQ